MTPTQAARRQAIMLKIVQRYIFDKKLEPLENKVLVAEVESYDHLFTHAGIPTSRLDDVYAEAMRTHGPYLLKVDDYLRAWEQISEERIMVDTRPMGERGADCTICHGKGSTLIFLPKEGIEIEKECPYHCKVVTDLMRRPPTSERQRRLA